MLYYLGTKSHSTAYANPHDSGVIEASRSSDNEGQAEDFVGRKKANSCTKNVANSWMMVDLGFGRALQVDHYCLRHGYKNKNHKLRNWNLEGSNNNIDWTVLREHNDDTSLAEEAYSESHWDVNSAASNSPYRFFRILKTGKTNSKSQYLCCCGIELYGMSINVCLCLRLRLSLQLYPWVYMSLCL